MRHPCTCCVATSLAPLSLTHLRVCPVSFAACSDGVLQPSELRAMLHHVPRAIIYTMDTGTPPDLEDADIARDLSSATWHLDTVDRLVKRAMPHAVPASSPVPVDAHDTTSATTSVEGVNTLGSNNSDDGAQDVSAVSIDPEFVGCMDLEQVRKPVHCTGMRVYTHNRI